MGLKSKSSRPDGARRGFYVGADEFVYSLVEERRMLLSTSWSNGWNPRASAGEFRGLLIRLVN